MRPRPPCSAEEDENSEVAPATSLQPDDNGKRRSFTSAKYDGNRYSDTLDRRKGEKVVSPAPPLQNARDMSSAPIQAADKPLQIIKPVIQDETLDKMSGLPSTRRFRRQSPWACSLRTLIATIFSAVCFIAIYHSFKTRQLDPKGCEICYMSPTYVHLKDFDSEHTRFASKYSLHLYREQGIDDFEGDPKLKGIPVLFIPGNAGSYRQVRPLAAEAAQYFHDSVRHNPEALKAGMRSLDFFAADFNEDITAFHGQTLLDQAEYLNEAVAYILSLYPDSRRSKREPGMPDPCSVILVGHSMGGVVARAMLALSNYQSNSVNTIITMSAPHARPPVSFDSDIVRAYKMTNDYWRQAYSKQRIRDNPLEHVTLISIGGGALDTVIPSDYVDLSSLMPESHGFTVFTSTIPNVWTGTDHLSILWCNQLRKVIVRSLIDVLDVRRAGQTKPRTERMRIFRKWYLTGMERAVTKSLSSNEPTILLTLEDNAHSILLAGERLVLRNFGSTGKPKAHLLPIPLQGMPRSKKFSLLTDQLIGSSGDFGHLEVLLCSLFPLQAGQATALFSMSMDLSGGISSSTRLACKDASSDVTKLPASLKESQNAFDNRQPFSYLEYTMDDLVEHQFVAVIDKLEKPITGWIMAEFPDVEDSVKNTGIGLQRLLAFGISIRLPSKRPIATEIRTPALQSSLLAYKFSLENPVCTGGPELFAPLLRQYLSSPHESKYFVNVKDANINLHGIAPFMPEPFDSNTPRDGLSLQLWSDPMCNTTTHVSLEVDIPGSLGKLVMRYMTVIAAFPILVVALVLRKQFKDYDESGYFMTFTESLDLCLRSALPLLLMAMSFLAILLATSNSAPSRTFLPGYFRSEANATEPTVKFARNDLLLGSQDPFFWFLVPLFGLMSVGICMAINYVVLGLTHVLCCTYSSFSARPAWLKIDDRRRAAAPGFASSSPRRRIITTSILLLLVSTVIPYQFAFMVVCIVQLATCTRALCLARETRSGTHYNFYNCTHSILILLLYLLPINIPILVVWVHNLAVHYLTPFSSHHNIISIMPFILLVETLTSGKMIPRVTNGCRYVTGLLFLGLSIYAGVLGISYAYGLHGFVNVISAWLVMISFAGGGWTWRELLGEVDGKKRP